MCVSCGCGEPNENHGDPSHITMDDLQKAGQAAGGITPAEVSRNIQQSVAG